MIQSQCKDYQFPAIPASPIETAAIQTRPEQIAETKEQIIPEPKTPERIRTKPTRTPERRMRDISNFADEPPIQSSTPNRPVSGVAPRIDQTPMQREQSSAVSPEESTRTTPLPVAVAAPRSEGIPPLKIRNSLPYVDFCGFGDFQ